MLIYLEVSMEVFLLPHNLKSDSVQGAGGEKLQTDCSPVLFLKLSKQLHIIWTELRRRGRREGRRGQGRRGGGGGSGLQGCGRGHLTSHLTD